MRALTYYVAMTIDGFIAGPDGSLDIFAVGEDLVRWVVAEYPETLPTHVRTQLGVHAFSGKFDTVVQGRGSYLLASDAGLTSPFSHLRQYVVSGSASESPDPDVEIIADDVVDRIRELKQEEGEGIYLAGGGRLAGSLLGEIDQLVVKVYPVVAGSGIPLFTADFSPTEFVLTGSHALNCGVVVLSYTRQRTEGDVWRRVS